MCVGVYVDVWGVCEHVKTKAPDRNDLNVDAVVVVETMSRPIDFWFKGQGYG